MSLQVKINGIYYSWEDVHNRFGYTEHPTIPMDFKSAVSSTWGVKVGSGYWDNIENLFWCESRIGWPNLDSLLVNFEVYPSQVTSLYVEKGSVVSPAVMWDGFGESLFLVKNDVSLGWMSEIALERAGYIIRASYLYDADSDTLTACAYDDESETVETL